VPVLADLRGLAGVYADGMVDRVLIFVPMRAGSMEVNRKNIRRVTGADTLASTSIRRANDLGDYLGQWGLEYDVVISTDDPAVEGLARSHDVRVFQRDPELANTGATLQDAVAEFVESSHVTYGLIVVLQATSPWLELAYVQEAVTTVLMGDADSATTITPAKHLMWNGSGEPLFQRRVNRQFEEEAMWSETGGCHVTRGFPRFDGADPEAWMISSDHALIPVSPLSAMDVDSATDLLQVRAVGERSEILYLCLGDTEQWGGGHIRRARLIAEELELRHGIEVFCPDIATNESYSQPELLRRWQPDSVFVNVEEYDLVMVDMLEEGHDYLNRAVLTGVPCIAFETENADSEVLTINELLPTGSGHLCGPGMATIGPDFYGFPVREHKGPLSRILVCLGAADVNEWQQDLMFRLMDELPEVTVVGVMNPDMIAYELWLADMAVLGHGRMTLEAGYLGTPFVALDQNERESDHVLLPGCVYVPPDVSDSHRLREIMKVAYELNDPKLRNGLSARLMSQVDGGGVQKICQIVDSMVIKSGRD